MEDELDAVIASNNMRECRHCKCSGFQTSDECAEHEIMCRENGVLRAKVEAQEKEIAALKKAQVEDKDHYERHLSGALDDRDNRIDEIDRLEKSVRQLIGFYRIEYKSAHNGELPDAEFNLAEREAEAALRGEEGG